MFLALAGVFSACAENDDFGKDNKGKDRPVIAVEKVTLSDHVAAFKLTASDEASMFAYAVYTKDAEAPSAYDIMVGEASDAAQAETFFTADGKTKTITLNGLASGVSLKVYAAAMNETGFLSTVETLDLTTPDTEAPKIAGATVDGTTAILTFNENIKLGSGTATVQYVKWGLGQITDPVAIPAENITVEGTKASIVCPAVGAGAGYIVSYTAGLFEDLAGNKCAALQSGWDNNAEDYYNLGWDSENVEFSIKATGFEKFDSSKKYVAGSTITYVSDIDIYDSGADRTVVVLYDELSGVNRLYAEYSIADDHRTVTIVLPKDPNGLFDIEIGEGTFYDEYGNYNASYSPEYMNYYQFPINISSDVFSVNYTSPSSAMSSKKSTPFSLSVTYLDAKYVVVMANWFNIVSGSYSLPLLLGTVDYDTRTITFDGTHMSTQGSLYSSPAFGGGFYYMSQDKTLQSMFIGSGSNYQQPITIKFDENGDLTEISQCGWFIYDLSSNSIYGVYDMMTSGTLTKVAASSRTSVSELPSLVKAVTPDFSIKL